MAGGGSGNLPQRGLMPFFGPAAVVAVDSVGVSVISGGIPVQSGGISECFPKETAPPCGGSHSAPEWDG